ncbi:MAG: DUF1566 domain-containing protein [Desulfohalobiaceae bacterium]|nr:DUF1566 domain-containing protein [Desulfohalobiaceae bacterium]
MTRFQEQQFTVVDTLTGLEWLRDASEPGFPMTWAQTFEYVQELNRSGRYGHQNFRVPNRRELYSLVSLDNLNPCLPREHPFIRVFTSYYWTSTSCSRLPDQAWYIHFGGARVFKGLKRDSYMLWPVRTWAGQPSFFQTGQVSCFDARGQRIGCVRSGQDGAIRSGLAWPEPRFIEADQGVLDRLTGLLWARHPGPGFGPVSWEEAFGAVEDMNSRNQGQKTKWRLPSIFELESLLDLERHSPALPGDHPFEDVQEFYWSSSSSRYDPKYSWCLYLKDGALGVGFKPLREFCVWAVSGGRPAGAET